MNVMNQNGLLKQLEAELEYFLEANRKATFKSWVFSNKAKCSAAKLAEAGFIFIGSKQDPDSVKCFFCDKSLDCWDEDDDPWAEHQKHAPFCSFAKIDKPENALTLSEFIDLRNEFIENWMKTELDKIRNQAASEWDDLVQSLKTLK